MRRLALQMLRLLSSALQCGKSLSREELKNAALDVGGCPYYAAKLLSGLSDVTLITHQLIGKVEAPSAVLIVDEAHNLLEQVV